MQASDAIIGETMTPEILLNLALLIAAQVFLPMLWPLQ
jgi:hypothetical protein